LKDDNRNASTMNARLYVCSLARIGDYVDETGSRSLVTLLNHGTPVTRPAAILPERHLFIAMSDVVDPMDGHILPAEQHVNALLQFVGDWDRAAPMLIHCFAGVSRSTAAAFIAACALEPTRSEREIAEAIRKASPTATPNSRLVSIADPILGRAGRMTDAVAAIGRGQTCETGTPFGLEIG
jgi:predicted protein tyrosine phosphatase